MSLGILPQGRTPVGQALRIPRDHYRYPWQTRYEFKEPVAAPKGSRLACVAHFDNSSNNKWNPDPAKKVRWGPQTWDEMMIGFVGFTLDNQILQVTPRP